MRASKTMETPNRLELFPVHESPMSDRILDVFPMCPPGDRSTVSVTLSMLIGHTFLMWRKKAMSTETSTRSSSEAGEKGEWKVIHRHGDVLTPVDVKW